MDWVGHTYVSAPGSVFPVARGETFETQPVTSENHYEDQETSDYEVAGVAP